MLIFTRCHNLISMKNIFQSGLAIGIPNGCCSCNNMNFSWLYDNPVNLLWVDKIIITQNMWDIIMDCKCSTAIREGKETPFAKSTKLIYSILHDAGLVEIIPDNSINEATTNGIYNLISSDLELLGDMVKEDESLLRVGDYCHCIPSLWSLYASLYLSWRNDASFMLEEREISYLKQVLPLRMPQNSSNFSIGGMSSVINEVLRMSLPKLELGHPYLSDSVEHCNLCARLSTCRESYLRDTEKQVFTLLNYRQRDEIHQLCILMDKICSEKFRIGYEINADDLIHEINIEKLRVQKKINNSFKKIEKWKNIVMTISAGMTLGAFFSHPLIAEIGAAGVLASEVTSNILAQKEKQYSWVNLFNEK